MIKLKRLLTEAWPKWRGANADKLQLFNLATGGGDADTPSWFEEAGKTYDAFETEMKKLGCTKEPKNLGLSMTWEHWLETNGFGNLAKAAEDMDYSEDPGSRWSLWNKNVVANNKSATWKTADGTMILFVSTLESWDDWKSLGKEGLTVMINRFNPESQTGGINSCVSNYLWNIGDPVQLTKPNNSTCPKPITKEHRIKLIKDILSEAYAWERQEGKPLPTLAEVQAAYQAKLREDAGNEDPEEEDHKYEEPPVDDDDDDFADDGYMYEAEDKATKDYDGDGEVESGSEEYLGSRDKAIKAASNTKANTTAYGNYVNKARAKKAHLTDKDVHVYGIDSSGKGHKLTTAAEFDKYTKFTIKSKDDDDLHEYGGQDSDGIHADGPKNPFSDVREKEQMIESFNKRMLGNLHGHEYILREAFKRK